MTENLYSRRRVIQMGLGSLAGMGLLAACGGTGGSSDQIKLQLIFWGTATRDKLTKKAIDLFQKQHSNIKITSQFTDFNSYWNKLNTQIAGSAAPDLIQMDMRYIKQFVQKGQLLDLSTYLSNKTIDLSDFDTALLDSSKVNGKVYGVPMGGNYPTYMYNSVLLKKANVGNPPDNLKWTWDQFAEYATKLSTALKSDGVYGTRDNSYDIVSFEMWMRGRNKELYTNDGKLGYEVQDVVEWFQFWSDLRKAGGSLPIDVQTGLGSTAGPESDPLIKGKTVFTGLWSNQFEAFQAATKSTMGMASPPVGTASSLYLKASMLMSAYSKTKHPQEAADFIGFVNTNPDAIKALGLERGTPGGSKARQELTPVLTSVQQSILAYMEKVSSSGIARVKTVLDPSGAGAVADALTRHGQAIAFGKESVSGGAQAFYQDAQKALEAGQ
ncbi:MAG: extracellular solute-binding protein [Ktedonobacteraceae bacterium]|nr:extracellular solute-binding protein [Ktedonobacteraceae bacterium]